MKRILSVFLAMLLLLVGCGGKTMENTYLQITQEEAKTMMDTQDVIILDVREPDEYVARHISGAVLFPVGTIDKDNAAAMLPDEEAVILVYCRSGNRSKTAAQKLANLGYSKVYEFGGILTWPYEVEES